MALHLSGDTEADRLISEDHRVSEDTMVMKGKKEAAPDLHLRRVKGYLTTTVGTDPVTTKPILEWHFD